MTNAQNPGKRPGEDDAGPDGQSAQGSSGSGFAKAAGDSARKLVGGASMNPDRMRGTNSSPLGAAAGADSAKGAAKAIANEAATQAVSKGASAATGLPPQLTDAIARSKPVQTVMRKSPKWYLRWVALCSVVILLLIAAFAGLGRGTPFLWAVNPESAASSTPNRYLETYYRVAEAANVPWTLLAAVGARASYHGQVNPYTQTVPSYVGPLGGSGSTTAPASVIVVGDSLTADPAFKQPFEKAMNDAAIPISRIDAKVGESIEWGAQQLRANPPGTGQAVVVALGTNNWGSPDQSFATAIDRFMSAAGRNTTVFWVNLSWTGTNSIAADRDEELNELLDDARSRHANLTILDWHAYAAQQRLDGNHTDGIHYDADGSAARATFIAESLADGGGGTRVGTGADDFMPVADESCPTVAEPIVGDPAELKPAGPLLLSPNRLALYGYDTTAEDLQNICTSTSVLASRMAQVRDQLLEGSGIDLETIVNAAKAGSPEAAKFIETFWAQVMDRVGILGSVNDAACEAPSKGDLSAEEWGGKTIDIIWACQLSTAGVELVTAAEELGGVWNYTTGSASESATESIREALGVAWAFSKWGTADCKADADVAGVFPLTQATFDTYKDPEIGGDRCDPVANITAAARAFAAGEATAPAQRSTAGGPFAPMRGGWANIPAALGPPAVAADFVKAGPWQPAGELCRSQAMPIAEGMATDPANPLVGLTNAELFRYTNGKASDEELTTVATYFKSVARQVQQLDCGLRRQLKLPEALGVLIAAATTAESYDPSGSDRYATRPADAIAGADFVAFVTAKQLVAPADSDTDTSAEYGVTSLVPRLSSEQIEAPFPPVPGSAEYGISGTTGRDLVAYTAVYGGLYPGATPVTGAYGAIGMVGEGVPFAELFNAAGQKYGLDPRMLAAVASQESDFRPDLNCGQGERYAQGMMQFMPATARGMNPPVDPCDPASAIDGAARYLKDDYDTYRKAFKAAPPEELWLAVFAAYNAGPVIGTAYLEGGIPGMQAKILEVYNAQRAGWGEEKIVETTNYISTEPGVRSVPNKWEELRRKFPDTVLVGPTSEIAAKALQWSLGITGGTYMSDNYWCADCTSPDRPTWPDYNCSTMTAAAYRYATNNQVRLVGLSETQWMDTKNIVLVPASQAQPGDIFFEYTGRPDSRVGHVGLIVDLNGGAQAIWHACGASSCQSNGNVGIGYSALSHIGMWMTVSDPARKDDPSERGKFLWTTDMNKGYVGRVVVGGGGR